MDKTCLQTVPRTMHVNQIIYLHLTYYIFGPIVRDVFFLIIGDVAERS